jgi:hypothetical protein
MFAGKVPASDLTKRGAFVQPDEEILKPCAAASD